VNWYNVMNLLLGFYCCLLMKLSQTCGTCEKKKGKIRDERDPRLEGSYRRLDGTVSKKKYHTI